MTNASLGRRGMLATAAATLALPAAAQRSYGPDAPPQRYPDPDIVTSISNTYLRPTAYSHI